jgi:HlyD family secretion protein
MSTENSVDVSAPVVAPVAAPPKPTRRWVWPVALVVLLLLAVGGGAYWWLRPNTALPAGLASGNGRIEADEIDIDTKFAGRIAKLLVDEGDLTKAGQVLAVMDTRDLEAELKQAQAMIAQATDTLGSSRAALVQQKSQVLYAQQEIARTEQLVGKGFATREEQDQRRQTLVSAIAGQRSAENVISQSTAAIAAAVHAAELLQVNITDNSLTAPRDGRIEYRVANTGEVLPVGGKVFTMLDTGYVYMDIYLSTLDAGRVKLGTEARIVLDAYPTHPFPAKVVFVAEQAQFTPKTVETQDERDVLMFRVRARIDQAEVLAHADAVRSGLPGVTTVQTVPGTAWPANLQLAAPK